VAEVCRAPPRAPCGLCCAQAISLRLVATSVRCAKDDGRKTVATQPPSVIRQRDDAYGEGRGGDDPDNNDHTVVIDPMTGLHFEDMLRLALRARQLGDLALIQLLFRNRSGSDRAHKCGEGQNGDEFFHGGRFYKAARGRNKTFLWEGRVAPVLPIAAENVAHPQKRWQ
jgi:hypothetical protein